MRNRFLYLRRIDDLGVDADKPIRVYATLDVTHVLQAVADVVDATLAEHDVVIQVLAEPLPELHGLLVQQRRLGPKIVGANDGRIAAGIAAADPALLENGHVAHAMHFREVVRRREAVAASADDDRVVVLLRFGAPPRFRPVAIVANCVAQQAKCRIFLHLVTVVISMSP